MITARDWISIPLAQAFLCADCDCLGSRSTTCAHCGGMSLLNLASVLNRRDNSTNPSPNATILSR